MKKYIILIPIYNDKESLIKLIENINLEVKNLNSQISIIVVNDASSQQVIDNYQNIESIHSIKVINMKENRGHARCIASGLKYIFEKKEFDYVIPMDGDGEDRPEEIKNLIPRALPKYKFKLDELMAIFLFIVGIIPKFVKILIKPTIDKKFRRLIH